MANNNFDLVDLNNIPGQELINQTSEVASQMLTGAIPKDVQKQVEIISAEKGIASGIGQGEKQRNLTARDLGTTSFDIQSRGTAVAAGVADSQAKFQALTEQRYEFNRKQELLLKESDIQEATLALNAHQLISQNERYAMGLANELIVSNSRSAISGVQGNIDTLIGNDSKSGYFDAQDQSLLDLINKYTS